MLKKQVHLTLRRYIGRVQINMPFPMTLRILMFLSKVNTICNFLSCTKSFSRSIVIYTIKTPVNGRIWHIKILGNKLWHLVELSDIGLMTGGVVSSYKNINYTDTVQAKFDQITAEKNLRSFRIITKLSSAFLHVDNRLKKNTTGLKLPSEQMARCFTIVNYGFTKKSLVKRLYHTHPQR